ncbi:hypothetical protein PZT66_23990 [Pseudomonas aeruginosa]|nr:hypothetical protein [Pseudomonas aeruginosa]EIU2716060.1 hypothetical protein [Pseudomonas aeruginosa]EIU2863649.1 hypothetical protein [Pseudomonas aeruginosa]ELD5772861.1 hypothetical protein [Pseudomonas aeruginosa]ERW61313.1 hypothetical protein Q024_06360 [Pseudomonas aeruginosa BWHPSA011]ETV55943.1 hypothetical protein Q042_05352 [Pseudomonas aeruginosa BWHPSA037]
MNRTNFKGMRAMAAGRAKKGGEVGLNGEFYQGGSFLPSTRLPKRSASKAATCIRVSLVEPGVRQEVPDGKRAIFQQISAFVSNRPDGSLFILPHLDSADCTCWEAYGPYEHIQELVTQYNSGARFVDAGF